MKGKLAITILYIPILLNAQIKKKVLFIGNSYIYANTLPQMISDLALTKQDTLLFDQSVVGGFTFNNHCNFPQTWQKIRSNSWDFVVLQAQSQEPSFSPAQVMANTYPFAKQLNDSVKAANPCTEVLFFLTWGRKNGDAMNCPVYPPVCTYNGMQARLRESYMAFKDSFKAACAPVGVAWKRFRNLYPLIDLYQPDESHPSVEGSYLAACVFYSSIFKKASNGSTYLSGINSATATLIQNLSSQTVLDSMSLWNAGATATQITVVAQPSLLCPGQSLTITASGASTYSWNTGVWGPALQVQSLVAGPLSFTLSASNQLPCWRNYTLNFQVGACTGQLEKDPYSLEILIPQDEASILLRAQTETPVQIYSLNGNCERSFQLRADQNYQLKINTLKSGLYLIRTPSRCYKIIL